VYSTGCVAEDSWRRGGWCALVGNGVCISVVAHHAWRMRRIVFCGQPRMTRRPERFRGPANLLFSVGVGGSIFKSVRRRRHGVCHSHPSNVEVKMSGYTLPRSYVTVRRFCYVRYSIIICFSLLSSNYSTYAI
jgi:hypothetical protein